MIVAFIEKDHRKWDKHLLRLRFAYNTACHSSLGTSPTFLNFGRELLPPDTLRDSRENVTETEEGDPVVWSRRMAEMSAVREWVTENLERANQQQAARYNLRRRSRRFCVGELVLRRQHVLSSAAQNIAAKLAPKFQGPFRIGRVISPVVYELERPNRLSEKYMFRT
ncbi:uncharacterized protein LOC143902702 [Temnothorax americanus]|uniref:uncharacterized protein LOC143902702 n=1 Tax=Temnothorax americanus TaxID=1964332 RepID=UPI0040680C98